MSNLKYNSNGEVVGLVEVSGSNAAQGYSQLTVTVAQTVVRVAPATQIEIFVESGSVRVRTDGSAATATLGQPLGEGFSEKFAVASLSIIVTSGSAIIEAVQR